MPTDLLKRVDWDEIYPPFRDKCFDLAAKCRSLGQDYFSISGYRSPADQLKLWQQGRNTNGSVVDPANVVTHLKFGMHQLGLAIDWALDLNLSQPGLQPNWSPKAYKMLADEAVKLGLEAGFYWKGFVDPPHIQVPIGSKSITIGMLKGLAEKNSRATAWKLLGANGL